jgi:hypothetical protein
MYKASKSTWAQQVAAAAVFCFGAPLCMGQVDPGVRGGPPGAGNPLPGLTSVESAVFDEGVQRMIQLEAVCDDCSDLVIGTRIDPARANLVTESNSSGLGTRFNGDQCSACHNQPAVGGSGGFMVPNPGAPPNQQRRPENPMFDLIPHRKGGANAVPSFITRFGPIREVRFARKPDGSPDGGVHQLFTVVGRSDVFPAGQADTCSSEVLPQPDFEPALPHSAAALRAGHHRWNPGSRNSGTTCRHGRRARRARDHGRPESQWQ